MKDVEKLFQNQEVDSRPPLSTRTRKSIGGCRGMYDHEDDHGARSNLEHVDEHACVTANANRIGQDQTEPRGHFERNDRGTTCT